MKKPLLIHHTCYPSGEVYPYSGMKRPIRTESFNVRTANVVRNGGIAYKDLSLEDQAKKLIQTLYCNIDSF